MYVILKNRGYKFIKIYFKFLLTPIFTDASSRASGGDLVTADAIINQKGGGTADCVWLPTRRDDRHHVIVYLIYKCGADYLLEIVLNVFVKHIDSKALL